MAYIGQSIKNGTFTTLDTSGNTYNGSNTAFALGTQVGSPAQLLVSHDGVIQKPGTDYTLSSGGTAITFTTAPASGASIFIVEISGAVGGPLGSDLNGSELILDADGDTSLHASTDDQIDVKIAGADDFKFTANAMNILSGSTLTIDSGATITNSGTANGFGGDNTPAFFVNHTGGDQSIGNNSATKVDYDNKVYDTNTAFNLTTDRFVVPTGQAGKYYLHATGSFNTASDFDRVEITLKKNGTDIASDRKRNFYYEHVKATIIADLAEGDYIEVFAFQSSGGAVSFRNAVDDNYFVGFKLII